jgi:chemotaxis response regulator CheB
MMECGYTDSRNERTVRGAMAPTVLIVDDRASFRRTARVVLQAEGFLVVGEAADGAEALAKAAELHPDVVVPAA